MSDRDTLDSGILSDSIVVSFFVPCYPTIRLFPKHNSCEERYQLKGQQLQVLRDKGVLRFLKRGFHRMVG